MTARIRDQAHAMGFSRVGFCPATTPNGLHKFAEWLELGYHGEMRYLQERAEAYSHPSFVLDGTRSLVMLTMNYGAEDPAPVGNGQGRVSRYAWGDADYHDVIHQRLKRLKRFVEEAAPGARVRGVVDTAPLLEREYAQMAGLGWVGKHTLLLNRENGSWFFLAALLTDLVLDYDEPATEEYCGSCTACLDACPTNAFPQPFVLDATKCISYLTIELQSPIPSSLREGVGDWIFGCDVCQDVCPWNRFSATTCEPKFQPRSDQNPVELARLFDLDEEAFRVRFRRTPLWRSKRRGILRNAAIVLGNQGDLESLPALILGIADSEPLVRGASAWALGQIGGPQAVSELRSRLEVESDAEVVAEIRKSLEN